MTSASTLARKAAKSKNPAVAKRLRSQAARLRREARAKSKKGRRSDSLRDLANARLKSLARQAEDMVLTRTGGGAEFTRSADQPHWQIVPEIISGNEIEGLRDAAKQKHKTDVPDRFAIWLRTALVDAKVRGKKEQEEASLAQLKTVHEINRINVVSAFIAELNGIAKLNGGPLPASLVVSGFTLARVLDALRDAGHTTEGKEGIRKRT